MSINVKYNDHTIFKRLNILKLEDFGDLEIRFQIQQKTSISANIYATLHKFIITTRETEMTRLYKDIIDQYTTTAY